MRAPEGGVRCQCHVPRWGSARARARTVLSEQMTVVHPSVSTLGNLRTMALRLTILRVPRARQRVITAGSPSGMAATPARVYAAERGVGCEDRGSGPSCVHRTHGQHGQGMA